MDKRNAYTEAGFSCFPLIAKSKKPELKSWQPFQSRKPTAEEVERWVSDYPDANVANVTGAISGVVVLDIDSEDAYREASRRGLPFTVEATTPRGRHIYFKHPDYPVSNIAGSDKPEAKLPKGLDLRGDGGYVVAAGSYYVPTDAERAAGKVEGPYNWREGHEPNGLVDFAPLPQWLVNIVSPQAAQAPQPNPANSVATMAAALQSVGSNLQAADRHPYASAALEYEVTKVLEAEVGSRNSQLNASAFAIAQLAKSGNLDEQEAKDLLTQAAQAAGLESSEIKTTIASGWRKGMSNPRECPSHYESIYDPMPMPTPADVSKQEQAADDQHFASLKSAAELSAMEVPEREYLLDGWLPVGCVTALFGDGGTGKSLVAMCMAAAIASGRSLWGSETTQAPVLAFYCEDDEFELVRRQQAITTSLGLSPSDLSQYLIQSRFGLDSSLANFSRNGVEASKLFDSIRRKALQVGARLVVIDNINMVFTGDGNDAGQVTRFMSQLNGLALAINGSVLLLGHTAKAEGSRFAGSTAWSNASRNRLFFARPDNMAEAAANPNLRHLTIDKSNYGATGECLPLLWHYGSFIVPSEMDEEQKTSQQQKYDEQIFLQHLAELTAEKRALSINPRARNYAPRVFSERKRGTIGYRTKSQLEHAMGRLLKRGAIAADQPLGWQTDQRKTPSGIIAIEADPQPALDAVVCRSPAENIIADIAKPKSKTNAVLEALEQHRLNGTVPKDIERAIEAQRRTGT